jgi:Fe-S cluster assembly protein SufD
VKVSSLAAAIESDDPIVEQHLGKYAKVEANPFVALNTGFIRDGAYVHLGRGVTLEKPIHLMFVSTPDRHTDADGRAPAHSHVADDKRRGDDRQELRQYGGEKGVYFDNAVVEIVVGNDCRIDHNKLQHDSLEAFHISTSQLQLGRNSRFISHSATHGCEAHAQRRKRAAGRRTRRRDAERLGPDRGDQHCDNHTLLEHWRPTAPATSCTSTC